MTETLDVIFCPNEFRFYYNEVKIETSNGDNLVVPIYGYPSISDFKFPKYVDFGICPLDSVQTKQFKISSEADIPFEFKIETEGMRPEFTVTPTEGIAFGGNLGLK